MEKLEINHFKAFGSRIAFILLHNARIYCFMEKTEQVKHLSMKH